MNKIKFEMPSKEEIKQLKAKQQAMEMLARLGNRTIGVTLDTDKKEVNER